jgi:hypothetical protein
MHVDRIVMALSATAAVTAFLLTVPPIAQDEAYHLFADGRAFLGIPNFWNVASNLPFALVGGLGLWKLRSLADRCLFGGILLTFFGSAYYHLAPSDGRLIWDRLPMTVVFMSLLACVISKDGDSGLHRWGLLFLIAGGIMSVVWWSLTGDLRLYILIQFGPLLILIPALWFVRDARYLVAVLAFYSLAKLAEFYDRAIFAAIPASGHTVKHLLAAMATFYILRWRQAVAGEPAAPGIPCEAGTASALGKSR